MASRPAPAAQDPACVTNSEINPDGTLRTRPAAYLCGTYGLATTRSDINAVAVTMDYFTSLPPGDAAPKALLVLIAGSGFDTRITGETDGGPATGASGNFLVRSAQLFANAGYHVVTLDRPSDMPAGPFADELANVDSYRVSVRHAIDILVVANRVNSRNLDVYLVGTSRGSMSVVANNLIANGIALSSPVTLGRADVPEQLFLTDPRVPRLQAASVRRPALVLRNEKDECEITPPSGAIAFYEQLRVAGVDAVSAQATGGFKVTAGASPADLDPCQSLGFHSFMGIESLAVGQITAWLDGRVIARGSNRRPAAAFASRSTAAGSSMQVDLASLAADPDGDGVTYALPYAGTSLGGSVSLDGSIVTYRPPAGIAARTDRFVYAATDARGATGAAVVTVEIGR